jgi:hypothetical protein
LLAELLGMGFDETIVRQAIQLTNTKDQAIDFIIKTLEDAESLPPPKFKPTVQLMNVGGVKVGGSNTNE